MALSKNQISGTLKMFAKGYINSESGHDKKELCRDFIDTFKCDIHCIEDAMKQTLMKEFASEDIIEEFETIINGTDTSFVDKCVISDLSMDDEDQIVKLISREIHVLPRYSKYDKGTVDDFMKTGYSFVAKHDDEVIGVVLAHKHMEYGSFAIYLNIIAVNEFAQGYGVGTLMINHLKELAHADKIYKIKLYTKRTLHAYEVYRHWEFSEDDETDGVFMTRYLF